MLENSILTSIFLIFAGAACLATLALYTRQSLLVVYMLLGVLLGPWGLGYVTDSQVIKQTGDIGIIFLLFLLGLNLHPQNLWRMLQKVTWVALLSSLAFGGIGFVVGYCFGSNFVESIVIGVAMMFSSTIIGLKLLPTTILHHQHVGEMMISILLMQDLLAIIAMLVLHSAGQGGLHLEDFIQIFVGFPVLVLIAYLLEKYLLVKLLARFDQVREYVFLLAIAWCLGFAELASYFGLSHEIGAFIGGVAIATGPIALYISESLKPLRDFFLVMFFFSIGASFDLNYLSKIYIPALILAGSLLLLKPVVFQVLLKMSKESTRLSWEVGVRLGQCSEFSLLVAYLATSTSLISNESSYLIQAATLITFFASSYIVVMTYPTPLGFSDKMRRD